METQTAVICPPDLTSRPLQFKTEKFIALSAQKLFKAWTTQFDLWFAAPGSLLSRFEINTAFFFETFYQGIHHPHYGRYLRIEENRLIEFTWITGAGGTEGTETVVTVELHEESGGTNLILTHAGFSNETTRDGHAEAWPVILQQMEERMSRPAD